MHCGWCCLSNSEAVARTRTSLRHSWAGHGLTANLTGRECNKKTRTYGFDGEFLITRCRRRLMTV